MSWFQPPGYVHVMVAQTWADVTVRATAQSDGPVVYTAASSPGFLAAGDDLWSGPATLAQAEQLCTYNFSGCVGITYHSADPNPTQPLTMYLKSVFQFTQADGWTSYESSRLLDTLPFSAQLAGGGATLVVRAVNEANVSGTYLVPISPRNSRTPIIPHPRPDTAWIPPSPPSACYPPPPHPPFLPYAPRSAAELQPNRRRALLGRVRRRLDAERGRWRGGQPALRAGNRGARARAR